MDTDVVIVGAGPTGLLLACELRLAGLRPVVLERRPEPSELPKANGLGGQIIRLLDQRGLLGRLSEGSPYSGPVPRYPFGPIPLELSRLGGEPPFEVLVIQQPRLERLLGERAAELGAEIRRGHELTTMAQDESGVTLAVRGPDGPYRLRAGYVVGCDGARSPVREQAGIGFPGTADPDAVRIGHFRSEGAAGALLEAPEVEVPGFGRLEPGWNHTPRGRVIVTSLHPGVHVVGIRERRGPESGTEDGVDGGAVSLAEFQEAARRVLGAELPLGEPIWMSRTVAQARLADRFVDGRVLLAGDAAHLFPAGGSALNAGMTDALNLGWKLAARVRGWAPPDLLGSYDTERRAAAARALLHTRAQAALDRDGDSEESAALRELVTELLRFEEPLRHVAELMSGADVRRPAPHGHPLVGRIAPDLPLKRPSGEPSRVAELMRTARPVLLDLGVPGLREAADPWRDRVDLVPATSPSPPAHALLIRPDGQVAWAADTPDTLPQALQHWFGQSLTSTNPTAHHRA
ncbi:FAD-dependent monooxygenase [Spongiactinospora sp. TRM90649]|uniref:FAD-dependent monooxygenase n=1 Tax=Spongiactinospora sp. TRM90649 TaxID=3031114 RepID=UPI0023F8CAB7|nr:FAD-dependent monooxygenase [Spongiactinospora sp. TRM90649]MDF5753223.1 FAD-dependent monooxygenase [Spongiactinospora sp. TRM90649]